MGTLESLNVSQELFFDASTDLPTKEFKTQKAKSNISEWRNSVSIEQLNVSEKESDLKDKKYRIKSKATSKLIPMLSKMVEEVITKEQEQQLIQPSIDKDKSDLNLIFQQSKNITEVLLSNKEGKLRTIKPGKTNIKPKISTKEAILVKQISLDDKVDEFKVESRQPAYLNQDLVQSCSLLIEQNQRLEFEDKYNDIISNLDNARTTLSESQLYLASIKEEKTSEMTSTFEKSVDERQANVEKLKSSLSHLTVSEIKANEKETQFETKIVNLQNVKTDDNLRKDQNLIVFEQNTLQKEATFDQFEPTKSLAKPSIESKGSVEISQPISLEKEIQTDKLTYDKKKASISQDKLDELQISDIRTNEKESSFQTFKLQSTKVLPIAQADLLSNYNQQSSITQIDERKIEGTLSFDFNFKNLNFKN